jgi:hypothetical protein
MAAFRTKRGDGWRSHGRIGAGSGAARVRHGAPRLLLAAEHGEAGSFRAGARRGIKSPAVIPLVGQKIKACRYCWQPRITVGLPRVKIWRPLCCLVVAPLYPSLPLRPRGKHGDGTVRRRGEGWAAKKGILWRLCSRATLAACPWGTSGGSTRSGRAMPRRERPIPWAAPRLRRTQPLYQHPRRPGEHARRSSQPEHASQDPPPRPRWPAAHTSDRPSLPVMIRQMRSRIARAQAP